MSVFARSDVVYVAIPVENGGCGAGHGRPVLDGAPAKLWRVDCPHCEAHLRHDPLWAQSSLEIPLTPDEQRIAKQMEEKGNQVMSEVSAALAKGSLEAMRASQEGELNAAQAKAERDELHFKYQQAMAELERLSALVEHREEPRPMPEYTAPEPPPIPEPELEPAAAVPEPAPQPVPEPVTVTPSGKRSRAKDRCPSCGGPMRKPGSRGPTPKGVCFDCRKLTGSSAA
jgi:hypothetical protein